MAHFRGVLLAGGVSWGWCVIYSVHFFLGFGVSSGGCSSIRVLEPSRCVLFECYSGVIR